MTRALVLGGSGALGRAVCAELSARDCRVAFTWHTGSSAAAALVEAHPGTLSLEADLTSVEAIERAIAQAALSLGGIDALVHCAAVSTTPGDPVDGARGDTAGEKRGQRIEEVSEAGWDALMGINVKSAFFACRSAAAHLRRAGGGNIVLIGSVDGVKPMPTPVAYATSKAALGGMGQSLAKELGADGIRVNVVAPGLLEQGASRTLPAELRQEYLKHCGMKRFGTMQEIASVVAWLACENTYVTGQTIVVDGAL